MMGKGKSSICIDCEKSCGLCAWSSKLKPVEGWTAKPIKRVTKDKIYDGYLVTECPLFEPADRKYNTCDTWTEEEIDTLKELVRQNERVKKIAVILDRSYRAVTSKMSELRRERIKNENH